MEQNLIEHFFDMYTNKEETLYRLPMAVSIDDFWPEELAYRREKAKELPLHSSDGTPCWFVETDEFLKSADVITEMARNTSPSSIFSILDSSGIMDEAYYSSIIEGAYSTRENAKELIASGRNPKDKNEQMIINNYRALEFVLEHLDYPVNHEIILKIGEILTDGLLEDDTRAGYRDDLVYVVSHTGETIYTAPDAACVPRMMNELISFMNDSRVHPVIRAVISHAYFVTIHPFFDGNGRTARALTYMILLKAGYDFFRMVPISGILSEERSMYYRALRSCQNKENGHDLTYFVNFYTSLLAGTVSSARNHLKNLQKYEKLKEQMDEDSRILKGAFWLASEDIHVITAKKWKNKLKVSFETARQDLKALESLGFLTSRREGRNIFFDV